MATSLFCFGVLVLISNLFSLTSSSKSLFNLTTDENALIALKNSIIFDPHSLSKNWSIHAPICGWTGVICGRKHHRVVALNVSGMELQGTIPPHLGNLTFLQSLDIHLNNFTGVLPIELSKLRRLRFINAAANNFTGEIPSSLFNISELEYVNLEGNQLTGSIPVFNIKSLIAIINLRRNRLSGKLPNTICSNTPTIWRFSVGWNQLYGEIPRNIGKCRELRVLELQNNNFNGNISTEIGGLSMLQYLYLWGNEFKGTIPKSIGGCLSVEYPNLSNNRLNGSIPTTIGNLTRLVMLSLSNNNLEGVLPHFLTNSSSLQLLHLKGNRFHGIIPSTFPKGCSLLSLNLNGNKFEGALPQSLANCQSLQVLDILRSNNFSGTISPYSKARLPFLNLQVFDISHNAFTGNLPNGYLINFKAMMDVNEDYAREQGWFSFYSESLTLTLKGLEQSLERILTTFTTIDLSSNRFSGSIPNSIGNLNSLRYLNLSHNCLTGHIPSSLGNVSELESLDLSSNLLAGEIPAQLTKLTFLSVINLSMNNLSGQIPQASGQFLTFENGSYVGNSGLCGFPLTKKCEEPSPPVIPEEDGDSYILEGFCWQAVVSGYGSGFVFGVSVGCFILGYGRPKWLVNWLYSIYKIKRRSS